MHIFRHRFWLLIVIAGIAVAISSDQSSAGPAAAQNPAASAASAPAVPRAVLDKYCITCHSQKTHTAGLDLETMDLSTPGSNGEAFEKIILKLRAGSMPPPGQPRPDAETYRSVATDIGKNCGPRVGSEPESRKNRRRTAPQSRRIQQRDSRPSRTGHRCETSSARRRHRRRQLRQLRGLPVHFDGSPGTIHVCRTSGHAPGNRSAPGNSVDIHI